MRSFKGTLFAMTAIGLMSIGQAVAMPVDKMSAALGENDVQNARVVCNYGRCYNTHRRSYSYAPRRNYYSGYYGAPGYGYYGGPAYGYYGRPSVGIGIGPFGFGVW